MFYGMNAIESMHEVRFPNIYVLSSIIYYVFPLTAIHVLALKAVVFERSEKVSVTYLQCIMVTSKIKHDNF